MGRFDVFYALRGLSGRLPLDHDHQGAEPGLCVLFLCFAKKLNIWNRTTAWRLRSESWRELRLVR